MLNKILAAGLFVITIGTILVMWQPNLCATAIPEVGVFVLAAIAPVAFLAGRVKLRLSLVLIPLSAAVLWPVLQLGIGATIYRWQTTVSLLYWATGAAVVFLGLQAFGDATVRRSYLRALVVAGFLLAIIAPLQLFTANGKIFWLFEAQYGYEAMGPFVYSTQYAAFIELLLPIALTGVFAERAGWRTVYGLAAVVMYASVLASASRSGFVLTTIEVVVAPLLAAYREGFKWRQLVAPAAIFLGMLVVLGLAVGPEKLVTKFQQENPYRGRREFAESSLRMIHDGPLLGIGMGNWSIAYPAYATFDDGYLANQAHNDWAQWAVEGGLPFAFFMFLVAIWSFRMAVRTGWGIGIALVFLQCFVDYPIQRMGVAIVFFTLIAAIAPANEQSDCGRRVHVRA